MSAILLYPSAVHIAGNPSQHGVADLALVLDTNDQVDTHVVLTADLLVDLYTQTAAKIAEHPIRLVATETDQ